MADNKKTIFQSLESVLDPFGGTGAPDKNQQRIIIKGKTPEDVKRRALEIEQQQELNSKFTKLNDHGFQKAMQYEAARLPAYLDYEGMEYYPLIASALDLFMEEATTIDKDGKMLKIYSDKERIKQHLEEFFYDIINVNVNLPFWTRNLPIDGDSMIPLLDGTEMSIKDISEKLKNNSQEDIWTYSVQTETNNIVGGKIVWCDKTRENTQLVRVTLDDGTYIDTTPDHEFMTRSGEFLKAKDLKANQSLMPFYTRNSEKPKDSIHGYEKVYNPSSNHYKYTHSIIAHEFRRDITEEKKTGLTYDTHHVDFNKLNNHPNNLQRLSRDEHFSLHRKIALDNLHTPEMIEKRLKGIDKYLRSDDRKKYLSEKMLGIYPEYFKEYNNSELHESHNKVRSEKMKQYWSDKNYKHSTKEKMILFLSDKCVSIINKIICDSNRYISKNELAKTLKNDNEFFYELDKYNQQNKRDKKKSINGKTLNELFIRKFNLTYQEYVITVNPKISEDSTYKKACNISKSKIINHKVVSVEYLNNKRDVYCMEVVGIDGEHDRHNFAVCTKNIDGSYSRNGVFVSNCKYGDNFVYLKGKKKEGITHAKQMVNYEMERIERVKDNKSHLYFKQRETGQEFKLLEMAHFRLLGDDKYLPYGSSILNKIRRAFRQLIMAEDSMLTYRITRAGEKRVFNIDVGNMDEDDIQEYMGKVISGFKKKQQVYPDAGQIDYRYNILGVDEDYFMPKRNGSNMSSIETLPGACLSLDTKIELLDGRSLSLADIIDEYDSGNTLWTYSIDLESGSIVPSPITWAGITRKNTEVLKLTLDNGETITCTPDHKFPVKYGDYVEAKDLKMGQSLWAFNQRKEKIKKHSKQDYNQIYDHNLNEWVFTHRMVDEFNNGLNNKKNTALHHVNFNRYDNTLDNLKRMDSIEHFKLHAKFSRIGSDAYSDKYHNDEEFRERINDNLSESRKIYHNKLKNDIDFSSSVKQKQSISRINYLNNLNQEEFLQAIAHLSTEGSRVESIETFRNNPNYNEIIKNRTAKQINTKSTTDWKIKASRIAKNSWKNNEYVKSVIEPQTLKYSEKLIDLLLNYSDEYNTLTEILENKINVNNSEFKKLFIDLNINNKQFLGKFNKITINNIKKLLKYYGYKNWSDFKLKKQYYNHKIINIEFLSEKVDTGTLTIDGDNSYHGIHNFPLSCGIFTKNSNLDQIADIQYLRDNLFTGLGVPKPFLGFQQAAGDGKNMAQMDIRFAKKVNRIQQAIVQELNKMAMIHLYLLGFKDDYQNFSLSLTNPSTQQEMLMGEMLQAKAQIYTEVTRNEGGIAAMSHTNAKRLLFNSSDEEIINDFKIQRMERALSQELQDTPLVIPKTGVFKDLDDKYGSDEIPQGAPEGGEGMGGDMEGVDEPNIPPAGDAGENAPQTPADLPPIESVQLKKPNMSDDQYGSLLEKMVKGDAKPSINKKKKDREVINENTEKVKGSNDRAIKMASEIESLLKKNDNSLNEDETLKEAINGERLQKLIDENMKNISKFHVSDSKPEKKDDQEDEEEDKK